MRQISKLDEVPNAKFFMFGQRRLKDGEVVKCLFECESKKQARALADMCNQARDFRKCAPVSKAPHLSEEARTFFYGLSEVGGFLSEGFVPKIK